MSRILTMAAIVGLLIPISAAARIDINDIKVRTVRCNDDGTNCKHRDPPAPPPPEGCYPCLYTCTQSSDGVKCSTPPAEIGDFPVGAVEAEEAGHTCSLLELDGLTIGDCGVYGWQCDGEVCEDWNGGQWGDLASLVSAELAVEAEAKLQWRAVEQGGATEGIVQVCSPAAAHPGCITCIIRAVPPSVSCVINSKAGACSATCKVSGCSAGCGGAPAQDDGPETITDASDPTAFRCGVTKTEGELSTICEFSCDGKTVGVCETPRYPDAKGDKSTSCGLGDVQIKLSKSPC